MTRKCSHCSNNGHNTRTCPVTAGDGGGLKLFGVRLTDGSIMKKSASMGNLSSSLYHSSSPVFSSPNPASSSGYLSDDPAHATCFNNRRGDRKKGVAWTEEEHRMFLVGLQKMGKGDWRGIARNFVVSRTPTQVASHAQKYFIRHTNSTRRKRRYSLFDMVPEMAMTKTTMPDEEVMETQHQTSKIGNTNLAPSLNLSLKPTEDFASHKTEKESDKIAIPSQPVHKLYPVPFPIWLQNVVAHDKEQAETSCHQVLKPVPILPKQPVNVDELVGISKLNLIGETEQLSLKLLGLPPRQSAFRANTTVS